jgi:hypothetical protein
MNTRFFAVLAALAVALSSPLCLGVAAAADGGNATSTTTTAEQPDKVSVELSPALKITDWKYVNGTWHITVKSKTVTRVKVSDTSAVVKAVSEGSGSRAVKIPSRGYTVQPGKTVIKFDGSTYDDASAVTVAGTGGSVLLRTGAMSAGGLPSVAFQVAAGSVLVTFAGTAYVTHKRVSEKYDEEGETDAERIL